MLYSVTDRGFHDLIVEKQDIIQARLEYAAPIMASIASKWIAELEPSALMLLVWIMGRTISSGKAADVIPVREFMDGVKDDGEGYFAPIPLSENTIRRHLKSLCDNDFLNVYRAIEGHNQAEKDARMFEINVKKLIETDELERRNTRVLREVEEKITEEKGKRAPKRRAKTDTPSPNRWEGTSYTNSISSEDRRLDKSNQLLSPAFGASNVVVLSSRLSRRNTVLPTPKKPRPVIARQESASAVVASVQKKHVEVAATRVAAAQAGDLSGDNLQALIDKAMKAYLPDLPRVVVTKIPLGVFRKRMKDANILDVAKFVEYTIREWTTFAAQNRATFLKNPAKYQKSSPLPSAPDFTSFAYRLPYFIAAYSNSLIGGLKPTQSTQAPQTRETTTQRHIPQRVIAPVRQTPIYREKSTFAKTSDDVLNDDWVPPVWEPTPAVNLKRRKVNGD
jgi:hypothetical protein